MSRIGRKPIKIPKEAKVNIQDKKVNIEGPQGKAEYLLPNRISIELKDGMLMLNSASDLKLDKMFLGTSRAMIANIVKGVCEGYVKQLEIVGVGFRAQAQQNKLNLQVGFTHPIDYDIPAGIKIETPKPNQISIKGIDKAKVGQVAAEIREIFPPEPYKGKGIRYAGEFVRKKLGKAVATAKQGTA